MTLEEMKQIDPASVDRNTLVDITEVEIDPTLPREELLKDYLAQIRNPYLFRCGDVVVKIAYAETQVTFEDALEQFIHQRQQSHTALYKKRKIQQEKCKTQSRQRPYNVLSLIRGLNE